VKKQQDQLRQIILKVWRQLQSQQQEVNSLQQRIRKVEGQPNGEPKLGHPADYISKQK
jgi:hypothetical protein